MNSDGAHSITSSARARSDDDRMRVRALAVSGFMSRSTWSAARRNIARFHPAQDLSRQTRRRAATDWRVCAMGRQAADLDPLAIAVHRRQACTDGQHVDANAVGQEERVADDLKGIGAPLEQLDGRRDVLGSFGI